MVKTDSGPIVFFDGECNLCNTWVDLLVRGMHRSRRSPLRFASLQGMTARQHGLEFEKESVLLWLSTGEVLRESTAVIHMVRLLLPRWAPVLFVLSCCPRVLRDGLYRLVARNRFRWFGRRNSCRLPTAEETSWFLP